MHREIAPAIRVFALIVAVLFAGGTAGRAAEAILPPFGLRWNDPAPKLERILEMSKAKIVTRENKANREMWTVEGLIHPGLKRTLLEFKEGFLVRVELHYEYERWSVETYNQRMGEIRRYFDAKFGTGKLVSRTRDNDTDVIQTLVGYQWRSGDTMLELFYFSAERHPNSYRTITVTYKAVEDPPAS
jgi:hypothetical protein